MGRRTKKNDKLAGARVAAAAVNTISPEARANHESLPPLVVQRPKYLHTAVERPAAPRTARETAAHAGVKEAGSIGV